MLKHFPTAQDRASIHTAIQLYSSNQWTRQQMMTHISSIMDKYGVSHMAVNNYTVKKARPIETVLGIWPLVLIEPDRSPHMACPVCREDKWGYLAGEAPVATAFCRGCGAIYERVVPDEKISESG